MEHQELVRYLVAARKSLGLTQEEVGHRMGTNQSHVSEFERAATDPRISTIQRYARAVEVRLEIEVCVDANPGESETTA